MESYWDNYIHDKPYVKLENWYLTSDILYDICKAPEQRKYVLFGEAYGHPNFDDGEKVYSTHILAINGINIETKNTNYVLGDVDVTYSLWCEENNIQIDAKNPIKIIKDFL